MKIYKVTRSRYSIDIRDPFNYSKIIHKSIPHEESVIGYFSEEFAYACLNYEQEAAEDLKLKSISRSLPKCGYDVLSYLDSYDNLVRFTSSEVNVISTLEEFQHYKLHH